MHFQFQPDHSLLHRKDGTLPLTLSAALIIIRLIGDIHSPLFGANDVSFICRVVYCAPIRSQALFLLLQNPCCTYPVPTTI